jgi:Tol biopolymer transport system component
MLRWARVPAAAFVLVFAGSLAYFELLDGGTASTSRPAASTSRPAAEPGRLVVTYSATARNPDRGFLGTVALDGSDLRNVIEPPGGGRLAVNASPAVSPGGDTAAFQRAVAGPGGGHLPHIYVIPLDGSKPERRLTRGAAAEVDPTWSHDGKRIVFARQVAGRFDLFACAADGSGLTRLTRTPRTDELAPAWSPDGAWIAFARYENGLERGGPGDLWLMSAAGGGERRVRGGDGHDYSGPAWSPDGRQLALLMDGHIAVTDRSGAAVRGLTADEELKESRPSWSSDGSRIAFTRDPGSIVITTPSGSNERKVPFDKAATGVAWVPER